MKQQPIKRKRVIKFLNKVCKHLPEKEYKALDKLSYPKYQDAEGKLWEESGEDRRMVWKEITTHTFNNKRMCLHLYDRWGIMAVDYYFKINKLQIMSDGSVQPFVIPENASQNSLEAQISPEITK